MEEHPPCMGRADWDAWDADAASLDGVGLAGTLGD